ncbi:C4-dicarboxylate ABC transporter [Alkalibacterium sp. f15]|uniref:C4-dicarboxylate ABC transporter n=1 Tax=Alkalibacterium sp. f15 TaxID=3414029 RepID=UPI003BF88C78
MNMNIIGMVIGWVAISAAIVGFFWQTTIMAIVAIVLGIIGFFLKADIKRMSITAIGIALVALLFDMVSY